MPWNLVRYESGRYREDFDAMRAAVEARRAAALFGIAT